MHSLAQVLRTCLPYDAKHGEILVQKVAKGGNKVRHYWAVECRGRLTYFRGLIQIITATLPEDLDGHEVLLLLPEFTSIAQIDKIVHVRS